MKGVRANVAAAFIETGFPARAPAPPLSCGANLQQLKREEHDSYRKQLDVIASLRTQAAKAQGDTHAALMAQIARRTSELPTPLTFGLYFPEDSPEDVARVTHLRVPFVSATISSEASAGDLAALGVHVRNRAGNIYTAYLPLDLVRRLKHSPAIGYIELARPWKPQLDVAIPQTQIDTLHSASPTVTGKGVIVGIVDVGPLDFYHPAFRLSDGIGEGGLDRLRGSCTCGSRR